MAPQPVRDRSRGGTANSNGDTGIRDRSRSGTDDRICGNTVRDRSRNSSTFIDDKFGGDTANRRGGTAGGSGFRGDTASGSGGAALRRWFGGATARLNIFFADDVAGHMGSIQCLPSKNDSSGYEGTPAITHNRKRSSSGGATVHPT